MEPKYRVVIEWDDLLNVRIGAEKDTPVRLVRRALEVAAESLFLDEIAERVVKRQTDGVVLARTLPRDGR